MADAFPKFDFSRDKKNVRRPQKLVTNNRNILYIIIIFRKSVFYVSVFVLILVKKNSNYILHKE